jgi:hypothetical protein
MAGPMESRLQRRLMSLDDCGLDASQASKNFNTENHGEPRRKARMALRTKRSDLGVPRQVPSYTVVMTARIARDGRSGLVAYEPRFVLRGTSGFSGFFVSNACVPAATADATIGLPRANATCRGATCRGATCRGAIRRGAPC